MFTWFLDLMTQWSSPQERELMWIGKRAMLQAVNYTTADGANITVQRGFWFSAHENWKLAFLPYFDIDIAFRVFDSCERARTVHSSRASRAATGRMTCRREQHIGAVCVRERRDQRPRHAHPGLHWCDLCGTARIDCAGNAGIASIAFEPNIDWRTDVVRGCCCWYSVNTAAGDAVRDLHAGPVQRLGGHPG